MRSVLCNDASTCPLLHAWTPSRTFLDGTTRLHPSASFKYVLVLAPMLHYSSDQNDPLTNIVLVGTDKTVM